MGISDPDHKRFGGHFGTYPKLIDLRLGRPLDETKFGGVKSGEVYSREYERGLVLVNPTTSAQKVMLPLVKPRRYRDVFAATDGEGAAVKLELPAESGRVLIWK